MLAVAAPLIAAIEEDELYAPWRLYGCTTLDDIPCDMGRPFCNKNFLGDDQFEGQWLDGLV